MDGLEQIKTLIEQGNEALQNAVSAVDNKVLGLTGRLDTLEAQKPTKRKISLPGGTCKRKLSEEPGTRAARVLRAMAATRGDYAAATRLVLSWGDDVLARAMGEGIGSEGGYIVPPEYAAEVIELLYPASVIRLAGARILPMNSNVLNLPKISGGATAGYIGENKNIGKTQPALGNVQLTAKKLAALVPISNDLLRDNSPGADLMVRDDLVNALAARADLAFIRNDGTQNTPKGLRYQSGINTFAATSNTLAADLIKAIRLVIEGKKGQASRIVKGAWLMSARTWASMYSKVTTTGAFIYRSEMDKGTLLQYPYFVTSQIPDNLSSDKSELYFGDFIDFVIGENESLIIDVSQEAAYYDGANVVAAFSLDQTVMRAIQRHDCGVRHAESFTIVTGVPEAWT